MSETANNILKFPEQNIVRSNKTAIEPTQITSWERELLADEMACDFVTVLLVDLYQNGISVNNEEYLGDKRLVVESIKSLLLKTWGISHPLQDAVNDLYPSQPTNKTVKSKKKDNFEDNKLSPSITSPNKDENKE